VREYSGIDLHLDHIWIDLDGKMPVEWCTDSVNGTNLKVIVSIVIKKRGSRGRGARRAFGRRRGRPMLRLM
jgi:hypothetical protein